MAVKDLLNAVWPTSGGAIASTHSALINRVKFRVELADVEPASGDVLLLARIPQNTYILGVIWKIITLEGAILTVDIGDYTTAATPVAIDADGWGDGVDLNAGTVPVYGTSIDGLTAYAGGKYYTSDAYLTVLINDASADAAVFEVEILAVAEAFLEHVTETDRLR